MQYQVLGLPMEVEADSEVVRDILVDALGGEPDPTAPGTVLRLTVGLTDRKPVGGAPPFSFEGRRLFVRTSGGYGWADPSNGRADGRVRLTGNGSREAAVVLVETLALYMAQASARPVVLHAAAVETAGKCVLLAGRDGAGKSTLAYASLREGFRLLADDACFAAEAWEPPVIYGSSRRLSLLPDARNLFPEVAHLPVVSMLNGEEKLSVRLDGPKRLASAVVRGVVLLERTEGGSRLVEPVDRDAIAGALILRGGPPRDMGPSCRVANMLARGPCAALRFGPDIQNAVMQIRSWLERQ